MAGPARVRPNLRQRKQAPVYSQYARGRGGGLVVAASWGESSEQGPAASEALSLSLSSSLRRPPGFSFFLLASVGPCLFGITLELTR